MTTNTLSAEEQLMPYILGKWISKPIYAAAELKIADFLTDGPKHINDLAEMSNRIFWAALRLV
jgi:hypothetical protein